MQLMSSQDNVGSLSFFRNKMFGLRYLQYQANLIMIHYN